MANPLTEKEKHDIEFHLGWVMDQQVLLMSGNVVDHQIVSLLRSNVNQCPVFKVERVREALCECQKVLDQMKAVRSKFGLTNSGDVSYDAQQAVQLLEDEYTRWTDILADMFGGHKNAYSRHHQRLTPMQGLRESY